METGVGVLNYGNDPVLLRTRRLVLQQGGFHVVTISRPEELYELHADMFRVLVLCHTITPGAQQEAIALAQKVNHPLHTIAMTTYAPGFPTATSCTFLSPWDGPAALIDSVRRAVWKTEDEQERGGRIESGWMGTDSCEPRKIPFSISTTP